MEFLLWPSGKSYRPQHGLEPRKRTLLGMYDDLPLAEKSSFVEEDVPELLRNLVAPSADDLIRLLRAGFRNLTREERDLFMRKVLFEMKRADV